MNIETLLNTKNKLYLQLIALDIVSSIKTKDGGKGSGNFGHSGRPGEVGGSAPIRNDFLIRYENEDYREYENLKPGDTFEFHSQHFTTNRLFESNADAWFGGRRPVRLEIVGEKPFLSLEPYVFNEKNKVEYEGLVAGPVKVKSNELVTDSKGRKIRHMTLEYDWNSSKSFMQTQLKSLALKNKLYGETANKKE